MQTFKDWLTQKENSLNEGLKFSTDKNEENKNVIYEEGYFGFRAISDGRSVEITFGEGDFQIEVPYRDAKAFFKKVADTL